MKWGAGGLVLLVVAVLLRRALQLGAPRRPMLRGLPALGTPQRNIYELVAAELETQSAILGVSLNDAIEERDLGHADTARRLAWLAVDEWRRLADQLAILLNAIYKHLNVARFPLPVRKMEADRFLSRVMVDYVRIHELLDQLVFRSKLRFQLHIRVLRRAVETLSSDFERAQQRRGEAWEQPFAFWRQLDLDFHDFDLIAKESILAFRALLMYLPDEHLPAFVSDLQPISRNGVRGALTTSK